MPEGAGEHLCWGDFGERCIDADDALDNARAEIATLKRQVEVLAEDMSRTAPPENYPNHYDDWLELLFAERVQWWVKWSLEQARKGGEG
jgi:hypothetical protein